MRLTSAHLATPARVGHGKPGRRAAARTACASSLLAVASLTACSTLPPPQDRLAQEIAQYYARNAVEEDGQCPSPEIASVTKRKVLAKSHHATTLRVRYRYFDESAQATDWTRVLQAVRECTGFAERDFTLVRGALGYQVVEMSGPAREP